MHGCRPCVAELEYMAEQDIKATDMTALEAR
jgi:hypothetical protein